MQGFFRNPFGRHAGDAWRAGLAALSVVVFTASVALLALPACNECDSAIDPVKCSDLCTQDPPHGDCAQCQGDELAENCPQCLSNPRTRGCPLAEVARLWRSAGTTSGAGGMTGGRSGNGGNGGVAGAVSGGNGGVGGMAGGGGSGGVIVVPSCDDDQECEAPAPVCDDGECAGCSEDDDCESFDAQTLCDVDGDQAGRGACVECLGDEGCSLPTPHCVGGACEECETSADCNADADRPQCDLGTRKCVACTDGEACAGRGDRRALCDERSTSATHGQCVQCLEHEHCGNPEPQCDAATGSCEVCSDNDACEGRDDDGTASSNATCARTRNVRPCVQCVVTVGRLPVSRLWRRRPDGVFVRSTDGALHEHARRCDSALSGVPCRLRVRRRHGLRRAHVGHR